MNQRIQDLIRQSTVPIEQAEEYAESKNLVEPSEKLDVGKFANLIVDECLQIINNPVNYNKVVYTTYDKDQANGVARALANKIKEHFKDTQ